VQEELPLKSINRGIIWRAKRKERECSKKKKEGWQPEEKKHKFFLLLT
jgi:hypothetical protein